MSIFLTPLAAGLVGLAALALPVLRRHGAHRCAKGAAKQIGATATPVDADRLAGQADVVVVAISWAGLEQALPPELAAWDSRISRLIAAALAQDGFGEGVADLRRSALKKFMDGHIDLTEANRVTTD